MSKPKEGQEKISFWLSIAVTLSCAIALLLFFLFLYPYHLRHREQTMLFLNNWDWICETYLTEGKGGLIMLAGDWLQQWFYYIGAGPVIISLLLTTLGVIWFRISHGMLRFICKKCKWSQKVWVDGVAYAVAIVAVLAETSRVCTAEYPVGATLYVLMFSLLIMIIKWPVRGIIRCVTFCLLLFIGVLSCPMPEQVINAKTWRQPDMLIEHQMALDVEASMGNWQKVEQLTKGKYEDYNTEIYYRNLCLAHRGQLADSLLMRPQNATEGLIIPVNDKGNYFLFSAAGEVWWATQDLTMAEHASILGMIFSPRHTGSRNLRRLAEISLAKGDMAAADKYLRLLDQTLAHRRWAQTIRQQQQPIAQLALDKPDTLRFSTETGLCLRTMLQARPSNEMAKQYLLCYDLLSKDLYSFANDIQQFGCPAGIRVYEEAMLIIMASRPELRDEWQSLIREQTYREFVAFNEAIAQSQGQLKPLHQRFGKTYWFYFKANQQ